MRGPHSPSDVELRRGEAAAWGTKPDAAPAPARLPQFTPVASPGATRAFLSAQMPSGLILNDLRLMRGTNGGYWIATPSIKMMDRDGTPLLAAKQRPL